MDINTPVIGEKFFKNHKTLVKHLKIGIFSLTPHIPIRDKLKQRLLLCCDLSLVPDANTHRKVGANVKRGVDID